MGMSPKQWDRVKELFEAALECNPKQRDALLESRWEDEAVRNEVRRLLAEQDHLGGFLSTLPSSDPSPHPADSPERLVPGEVLAARFRIINFLAAGGMGEVYKAEDLRLDRIVVLKFLSKELAEDHQSLERFRREAKAASALNHPNICTVHDFGEGAGKTFIAMEYLEGETLSSRINRGAVPLDETLKIAVAIAQALGTAHRKRVIHRDLKPGNIMLTSAGVKLLDFGLAKYERPVSDDKDPLTFHTGEARIIGTLPYMSPEQLQGERVGVRGDIFAFGAVLYEMLTGTKAFKRRSDIGLIATLDSEEPKPIREFVKDVPEEVERIIRRCLRRQPEERYASMSEIERELEDCSALFSGPSSGVNLRVLLRQSKRPKVAIPFLLIFLMLVGVVAWWIHYSYRVKWARDQALPQIAQLIKETNDYAPAVQEAYALAVQAERYIPHDPMLVKFWPDISWSTAIHTTPSGVAVYRRNYNAPESAWELVGHTPIENRRFPAVDSLWKFERKGFATVERATFPDDSLAVTMDEEGKVPARMVHVELPTSESHPLTRIELPGLRESPAVPLGNFWIDKYEVTNAEYKRFVDQGGYQRREYWKHDFRNDGRVLSWEEGMKLFQDKTGRPGPAAWILGEYPHGQDNYPVTGVSWFEAAAYAEFVHKSLPTIYHWTVAALEWHGESSDGPSIIPASNFGGAGSAPVGAYRDMSWSGAFDMAGNVKEWTLNEERSGKHYILGGAWNEPTYMFYSPDARIPFERSTNFGFRCSKYDLTGEDTKAAGPVTFEVRDYSSEKPVSDQVFRVYKSLYAYDKTPLHAVVEPIQQTDEWKEEKITFDAAYGGERITAFLFLPRKASPPFQVVVHFGGANGFHERSNVYVLQESMDTYDWIVKSGRAFMWPVFKGTYERWDDLKLHPKDTSNYRDHVIDWSKDLGRSIDYLETRSDIDHSKLAYHGRSFGGAYGALLPALDDRLKAVILTSSGFWLQRQLPEEDQINFAPRVRAPVLMLNGRFDYYFPQGSSQEPMFRLLGTPSEHKRLVVYDAGHDLPRAETIKEELNWLDRYLGPVK